LMLEELFVPPSYSSLRPFGFKLTCRFVSQCSDDLEARLLVRHLLRERLHQGTFLPSLPSSLPLTVSESMLTSRLCESIATRVLLLDQLLLQVLRAPRHRLPRPQEEASRFGPVPPFPLL
jgi:hypothetical protein